MDALLPEGQEGVLHERQALGANAQAPVLQ